MLYRLTLIVLVAQRFEANGLPAKKKLKVEADSDEEFAPEDLEDLQVDDDGLSAHVKDLLNKCASESSSIRPQ